MPIANSRMFKKNDIKKKKKRGGGGAGEGTEKEYKHNSKPGSLSKICFCFVFFNIFFCFLRGFLLVFFFDFVLFCFVFLFFCFFFFLYRHIKSMPSYIYNVNSARLTCTDQESSLFSALLHK